MSGRDVRSAPTQSIRWICAFRRVSEELSICNALIVNPRPLTGAVRQPLHSICNYMDVGLPRMKQLPSVLNGWPSRHRTRIYLIGDNHLTLLKEQLHISSLTHKRGLHCLGCALSLTECPVELTTGTYMDMIYKWKIVLWLFDQNNEQKYSTEWIKVDCELYMMYFA